MSNYNFTGPTLPFYCNSGSMFTLDNGHEAILTGCNRFDTPIGEIFKLTWEGDRLQWETLPHKLKYPRTQTVAMMIPNSMTNCSPGSRRRPSQAKNLTFV